MKKFKSKIVTFALALCLIVPCMFILTACGDDHTHTLTKVDAVAETCTTDGNSLYYKCDCGKYFSDEEAKTEIEKDSWIVTKTGHSWGEGVVTTQATPSADGVMTYTCHCGERKTETFTYTSLVTVTEEEWNQAFSDAMSKTVAKTIVLEEGGNVVLTAMVNEQSFYCGDILFTTANGNYYCYEKINGSWSMETRTEESYNDSVQYYWNNFFGYFRTDNFETASFNEIDGTYNYSAIFSGSTSLDYVATFMQGKLTKWTVSAFNRTLTFNFTEPTIEIPQV